MGIRETLTERFGEKALKPEDYAGAAPVLHNNHPGQKLTQRSARAHLSAYGGTDAIDWVMDCVNLIADTASNADYHFEKGGKKLVPEITPKLEGDDNIEEAPADLVHLIEQPNPWMQYDEMMELIVIDFMLTGNAFWLKFKPEAATGKPASLYRLAPPLVTVVPGETKPIDHYEYLPPGVGEAPGLQAARGPPHPAHQPALPALRGRRDRRRGQHVRRGDCPDLLVRRLL